MDTETRLALGVRYSAEVLAALAWPLAVLLAPRAGAFADAVGDVPFLRTWALLYASWWLVRCVTFPCYAAVYDREVRIRRPARAFRDPGDNAHFVAEVVCAWLVHVGTFALALFLFGAASVLADTVGFTLTFAVALLLGAAGAIFCGWWVGGSVRFD